MALEKLKSSMDSLIKTKKVVFRTYELICLEKLKELGISTAAEWSAAMGYEHRSSLAKVIKRIKIKYPDKLKVYIDRTPRQYEAI
ncbi:MAG: hypothetical protein ACFE8V_02695 [Promethearchaeota archaeon]